MVRNNSGVIKWVSILLVIISVFITLFAGAVRVTDKEDLEDWEKKCDEAVSQWNRSIGEIQQAFDRKDMSFDAEEIFEPIKDIIKVAKDGKVSAYEALKITKVTYTLSKSIKDNKDLRQFFGSYDYESYDAAKSNRIFFSIAFYLTIIFGLGVVYLHFRDRKFPGISVVIMNVAWLIIWLADIDAEADMFTYNVGLRYTPELTATPTIALIMSIIAMILWIIRNKISVNLQGVAPQSGNNLFSGRSISSIKPRLPERKSLAADPNAIKCGACGRVLNPGAVFCPSCGTKYVAPVVPAQPETVSSVNPEQGTMRKTFCPKCGAKLDQDSIFCGECGHKVG